MGDVHTSIENKKTAVILAGGKSSRFGQDKIFYPFNGKPIIQILIDTLKQAGFGIVLSGPVDKLAPFGFEVIEDREPFGGPLQALCGIWEKIAVDKIMLLAADMPFVTIPVLNALWTKGQDADGVLLETSPLPGVYARSTQKPGMDLLKKKRRDLWALREAALSIEFLTKEELALLDPNSDTLRNINVPEDLAH